MLDQTEWCAQASRDFWVRRNVGGTRCVNLNPSCRWVADEVLLCDRGSSQFISDKIVGQLDVIMDLDRLMDVDDCKWSR